jgi:hypothetical protein
MRASFFEISLKFSEMCTLGNFRKRWQINCPPQMMNTTANNHLRSVEEDERLDQIAAPSIRAALVTTAAKLRQVTRHICKRLSDLVCKNRSLVNS